ncbi:homeobox-leucine zipper protein revoluta [Phtheirospermum japonicum]|uniref:Homeobox-leucine zipper protein revoluta n=1 Tax=Phtheirospermum japonicum TaxID=374723 RepID=A0A830CSL0_9LAMI|nr:homeobox-leucine zipper protein revoluta [Phtheirospermum japonicum]
MLSSAFAALTPSRSPWRRSPFLSFRTPGIEGMRDVKWEGVPSVELGMSFTLVIDT